MLNNIKEEGQTLIEAIIALAAAVLVLSAITIAVISAVNNTEYTKNQNLATQYAQQGVEVMRQISESDWGTFSSYNAGKYCLAQNDTVPCPLGTAIGSCIPSSVKTCGQNYGNFVREVDIAQGTQFSCEIGSIPISVIVSWTDGSCTSTSLNGTYCHNVTLNSCISNHNSGITAP
jgi:type II secretory pathway pseudopilin PulG